LAALYHRTQVENADWIIYVTDTSQKSHFDAIFDAGRRAGWLDNGKRVDHVGFGLVTGEDGKRLRTRSGETVKLKDLLMEAKNRSLQQFLSREVDSQGENLESAALNLGVGAVKYADLRNNLSTNYTFSFERMLDMKGNTAVYLQYTIVRMKSIIQRANDTDVGIDTENVDEIKFKTPQERALLLHLLKFDDTLDNMINELMPSKICDYAYTLCVLFNNFYAECKIFGGSEGINRVLTCRLALSTLETCFRIIGLQSLSRI
jgi:arginyl-tRNA synthetase